ncbi:uncharacterized protein LOC135488785 isoform X2 [Lineus longissimus]|uniref:uncharacterized protein LOC135488785 isoform X2 n=1 Tax=Lineus longissimus TaxID=88925 RepID=UPI00315CEDAF
MDERHWWIAGKIQESFHIGGYDNPTLLEDFISEHSTMDVINHFLGARGPRRLFFYCEKPESGQLSTRELHVAQNLANLKDVNLEEATVLYFVRKDVEREVDASHMEKDVFCGELKSSTMETLTSLLSDIFIPMLRAQKNWGDCSQENKAQLMVNLEKYLGSLSDSSASVHTSKQMMLKQPERLVSNEYKQHRLAALDHEIISEYEELVNEWIATIEPILSESGEDRSLDPNAGPLSELDRWHRRQRLLTNITEQLKGKECKAVIGVLITAKSKLLKKWKAIDAGMTDAQNETKDKVKYLESLKRHLDQFYDGATPWSIMNSALPNLMTSVKQMDSISRYYARQGFLGYLFTKVTNQMVSVCKEYIRQLCVNGTGETENLWRAMDEEINNRNMLDGPDGSFKILKSQIEARLNKGFKRSKDNKDIYANNDKGIYDRLKAILSLQSTYKESVRNMREALGASLNLSHYGSMSSLSTSVAQSPNKNRSFGKGTNSVSPSKKGSSDDGHGVSISDEDIMFGHLDSLCCRVREVVDIINTLTQFKKIVANIDRVPRPRREDIVAEETHETKKQAVNAKRYNSDTMPKDLQPQPHSHHGSPPKPLIHGISEHGNLVPITEDEEVEEKEDEEKTEKEIIDADQEESSDDEQSEDVIPEYADEVHDVLNIQHGLTQEEVDILNHYYVAEDTDQGPSVVCIVKQHVQRMIDTVVEQITFRVLMDVETKDKDRFDASFREFLCAVRDVEKFIGAYLHAVFLRRMTSFQALDLICRFSPIQYRLGIKNVIAEKFVDIFNAYEADLIQVQQLYEEFKDSPPIPRNAPRIAGAISWSRQLLQRIEDPMRIFRDNRAVTNVKDYSRIVKIYNRIATALVTFESLWFAQLKVHIENAKAGLKATLFIHHPETRKIMVNADERVLELIQEAKWLLRLGISIPESAHVVLRQEGRFKNYKDHLELVLKDFDIVCSDIPECFVELFAHHIDAVKMNLQPGLSTLAWNSMNIDAFLHQVHTAITKLKYLVERVNEVIKVKVEGTIQQISEMIFFDYELAFSKSWPPEEFVKQVIGSVYGKSNKLYDHIQTIEKGMAEAANILTNKKSAIPTPIGPGEKSNKELLRSNKELSKAPTRAGTQLSSYTSKEDHLIAELLNFYCSELYRAILTATCRSLVTIAESCGCDDDIVRTVGVFSEHSSRGTPSPTRTPARILSAKLDTSRPLSVLSVLSDMSWTTERTHEVTYLRFEVAAKFAIPNITMDPSLDTVQHAVDNTATAIMNVVKGVTWLGGDAIGENFYQNLTQDDTIGDLLHQLSAVVEDLQPVMRQHLIHFGMYDFLWKDDLKGNFYEFISAEPGPFILNREVDRLLRVEKQVMAIPSVLPTGPVALITDPVKNALHGFAIEWKTQYASVLHEEAKRKLDAALLYRMNVRNRLELNVANLDQLNSTLHLLEELRDMENKIDGIYLPTENMYLKLREFELRLPRNEVEEVDSLRERWQELLELADNVRMNLMKEKRSAFEQELDKQVKTFVVEVIQFRNAFDAQGPAVPGITPQDAVMRLNAFQAKYQLYDSKRRTLDSVSKLFGIGCKPFPELDRTGEELELLGMLYGLYQKYIKFDQHFRDTLWADVDLEDSSKEESPSYQVESFWDECLALPSKLKDWEAYNGMKANIQHYLDVFPLLQRLASKREERYDIDEIRNRHWLQVMQVTGSQFQLEANVFKLCHLLDIGLLKHRAAIEEICHCASMELELEVKLRITEEEWTEQVLSFEAYKRRGPIFLEKLATERLLEQLEDAEALLAGMLTSRYIGPMREEAASWAEKLKEVGEVLELWLEVQDLWHYLEAVFSNSAASKELPQEAKRFARIDKGWTKMMKRAYDSRNVLQCCYGGEVPKAVVLRHIHEELELCFKSLTTYLDSKRRSFPRFYFVSDPILLAMLSKPNDLDSIRPYLKSIFTAVSDVQLEVLDDGTSVAAPTGRRTGDRSNTESRAGSTSSPAAGHGMGVPPAKVDKRLTQIHNIPLHLQQHISLLPSEEVDEAQITWQAVAVKSVDGESLCLKEKVPLKDGVEVWLQQLKNTISDTLCEMVGQVMHDVNNGVAVDEIVLKYPTQICRFGLLYYWTRECEIACSDIKYDRKALQNLSKKFAAAMTKLPQGLIKGYFKGTDESMLPVHKIRLEHLITYSLYLRDSLDMMASRKIREATDFDFRRNFRCYLQDLEGTGELQPVLQIVDNNYKYGCEFYGAQPIIALTTLTERCFISMAAALKQHNGVKVIGGTGTGKTETVKGFAHMLGHHLTTWQCSHKSDPVAMGKVLTGLSIDGCWGLFDEVQNGHQESISVLMDHAQAIFSAVRASLDYCFIGDGQEIAVNPNISLYMTVNPTTAPGHFQLPSEIKSLFRTVSLAKPDYAIILKLKCSALGFKAPNVLGTRMKIVHELAKDQLPEEFQNNFSMTSFIAALNRAGQRRRLTKEEKSFDKSDSNATKKDEQSRSNSQMSVYTANMMTSLSSASMAVAPPLIFETENDICAYCSTELSRHRLARVGGQRGGVGDRPSRKAGTPNPLSQAAKMEHALVGQALLEILGARLNAENYNILRQIVRDAFFGLPEPPSPTRAVSAKSKYQDVEAAIIQTAKSKNLIPHRPWLDKCMQLYNVAQVHQGIIVAGPPGTGKSSIIETLVESLCVNIRGLSRSTVNTQPGAQAESNHRLQKINPLVVDENELMFGHLQNRDWVDGIFTSAWRKANRNQCTTWLCLDGPLHAGWSDNFSSVLDAAKTLYLANGDRLLLSDNMKLLFETDSLVDSSPATVSRAGIIFVDKDIVGWKPIAMAWMEKRTQQEIHVLQRAFDKTVDAVTQFVVNECKPRLGLSEVGMFQTCINLLSAMLADNKQIGGELHIERLYLFCLIWAFGGLLEDSDRKAFSDLLKTLSSALPDDDRDICVFDYYVDESGEWDPWISRVPETVYADNQDILGEVFVDTVDTIRTRILMEFAVASQQNVMLVGPPGSGKTLMINDFVDSQDATKRINKRLVYSGASEAKQLQQFIEANIYHRQGFVFGAKENKQLQIFVDDLNLPVPDEFGIQKTNELLRQLLDDKVLCTLQKPFEWRTIEGLVILSSMSMNETPSVTNRVLNQRLLRHFIVLRLPGPQGEGLKTIVNGILESNMSMNDGSSLDIDLHNALTKASCQLLSNVQKVLRMTPMPGRRHYLFTLKDITTCFQCLRRLADESRADEHLVISLWRHEMERIMRDRLCRASDVNWFDEELKTTVSENFPSLEQLPEEHFVTFPIDTRIYQRPVTSHGNKQVKVLLQPIENLQDVQNCLKAHMARYNEEFGNVPMDIMLSDHVIGHIIKMHRVLSFHHGGNFLLIGAIGLHLSTLCRLALHVADVPIHSVDASKQNTFFDGLRSALRLSGSEGKVLSLMFSGRDLHDDTYLDAINSLLVSGEYPHLFTNDELEGLLQAVTPALRREHPTMISDPMKFFVSRVKSNLHIILCLPPNHKLIKRAATEYPGLLQGCQVNWVCDWPQDALLGESHYYIQDRGLDFGTVELSDTVGNLLANIHSEILVQTNQMPWAGQTEDSISLTSVKMNEKKKDQIRKTELKNLKNFPYSKAIILENIKLIHQDPHVKGKNQVFVGPMTYRRFMDTFNYLYRLKSKDRTEKVTRLQKVLTALSQSRMDAKVMRQAIKNISGKFEDAKVNTAHLLRQLTAKATTLEKLKAKVGQSTALSAFLQLNEMSDEEEEEDDLLKAEDYDDYDKEFDRIREANLKDRHLKAKEELAIAIKNVDDCRRNLESAKQQVHLWSSNVDRGCVERLRAFSQPPALVGHVMEMVMTLIGKRLPGVPRQVERETQANKDDQSSRMSASSSSTKMHGKKQVTKRDVSERVDRAVWKAMTTAMSDSTKFMDMMHNVQWEEGLSVDVLNAVESYLAKGRGGSLGVTGEGSLLENAPDNKAFPPTRRSPSPEFTRGITLSNARYASEDAATLVQYTIAIVEYTKLCGPLKQALERQHELEREIEESERLTQEKEAERLRRERELAKRRPKPEEQPLTPEPDQDDLTEDDLPRIQDEVNDLQQQFDLSVIEKHSLEMELISMNERIRATTEMIESLKGQEAVWTQYVKDNESDEVLLANCITASAFLTYLGPLNTDTRLKQGRFFMQQCEHHGIKMGKRQLFSDMELISFLYTPLEIKKLEILGLPKTRLMLENACFIMEEKGISAWPLVCDPASSIVSWISAYHKDKNLAVVKYHDLRSQLETSLSDGIPLIVTDVDVEAIVFDKRFLTVLKNRMRFINGTQPFKMMVGDHEVECQPSFRLYLHTTDEPQHVPPELAAHLAVILFQRSRKCVEEELLDRFMEKEKPRLEEERVVLVKDWLENMEAMEKIEEQMLVCLSSDTRLMNDLATTKKLADLKKQWDETQETQFRVDGGFQSIMRAREGFRAIAQRAGVLFDTSQYMREVNPLYKMAYTQFLDLFDAAIAHSDRASVKAVVERMTLSSYTTTMRALLERDRPIYSLLLAIEVEDSHGRVGPGEREYLLSPNYGSEVMRARNNNQAPDARFTQAKKPFDWMFDDQFHNLQTLASYFEWFQEMFERMPKDGRETQWRNLCESDAPEMTPLPDKADDIYTPMQRLCVIRAVRSDRLMQASTLFVNAVFGKKFIADTGYDFNLILKQSTPKTPILMLNTQEPEVATKLFLDFAIKKQGMMASVIHLYNSSHAKEKNTKKAIQKAMEEGSWILLQNAHNAPNLLGSLESFLSEVEEEVDPNFRCWVSVQMDEPVPTRVLQSMLRIVVDAPRTMKTNLYRFFSQLDSDILRQSERMEWAAFLHNICYLHGAIKLRTRFGKAGWNVPEAFNHLGVPELLEALQMSLSEFRDNLSTSAPDGSRVQRTTSWSCMRYLLTEIIYGNLVTDPFDQSSLGAMVDYWISPTAVKKEFELAKLRYKHPSVFFSPYCKLTSICQALEGLPNHMLEVPEACHLHPYGETILGDDQYVFTRLNKVFDAMPASETLTNKEVVFKRPLTPFNGPPQANVSASGNMPQVCEMGVVASASFAVMRTKKEVELWEICWQTLPKVPRAFNSDYVTERIKKIGGFTVFNLFIKKEFEIMWRLLTEIKHSLMTIKAAVDVSEKGPNSFGDQLTPRMLETADDLYFNRIPQAWLKLAGPTAPPPTYGVDKWLNDLSQRTQHFERILSLGKEKMPAYWLGAFTYPRTLLALLKQDAYRHHSASERSGNIDHLIFQTEITSRDKDHLRDPPQEGMFVYGINIWGCSWEKTSGELQDVAPRHACTALPVIHITCHPQGEKPNQQDPTRASETFQCPVFQSKIGPREPVMEVDLRHEGYPASRWALRGLSATIHPY